MSIPPLTLRRELLGAGWTSAEVQRMRQSGVLSPVRRGSYVRPLDPQPDTPEAQHLLLIRATLPHLAPGWVLSHTSAAVALGLPVWGQDLTRVHVSRDGSGGGRLTRGVHRHVSPLVEEEVTVVDGLRVTTPARTVTDVARTVPFEQAVVVADAALAMLPLDRPALLAAQTRAELWRGAPQALRAIRFADGGAGSPGESRSRVAMHRAGLPPPVLQYEIRTGDGAVVGRVDFAWPQLRTVGEFDGRIKYGRLLDPGRSVGDVLFEEKVREDAIRACGWRMARWIWRDIGSFDPVATRLRQFFTTGG
ncbi:hypothetical protein [Pseudonocardia abyssalis]|uniref:Transcriptional regulator, AbiEi antitoxin, Type IV TA system n=1 Tax=Pseudonocardia abyssalis TaxID=2792008 RepID=A0ABS6UVF3_9PSEU|nr:hypothetical protein [Pseudonocardia abyssalis]MBW0116584.1 hypothetical protein [Pseudonocardia abyssalis]MBW0136231.1 hypothetical protein [Pseudonocardia abyssalis]